MYEKDNIERERSRDRERENTDRQPQTGADTDADALTHTHTKTHTHTHRHRHTRRYTDTHADTQTHPDTLGLSSFRDWTDHEEDIDSVAIRTCLREALKTMHGEVSIIHLWPFLTFLHPFSFHSLTITISLTHTPPTHPPSHTHLLSHIPTHHLPVLLPDWRRH